MSPHASLPPQPAHRIKPRARAFTILELLVAMSVLVVIIAIMSQVMAMTGQAINAAKKQLDLETQSRIILDRIGRDLSNMVVTPGVTPLVINNTGDSASGSNNDGLAVITIGRPRDRSSLTDSAVSVLSSDVRMAVMGYRVISAPDPRSPQGNVPTVNRGDGTITWPANGIVRDDIQAKSDLGKAMTAAAADLSTAGTSMLAFEPMGQGIFRLEICYLLDDGTVVSTPPRDVNFPSQAGNTYALALSKATSADSDKRFVKALIVAIAGIDSKTEGLLNAAQLTSLANVLPNPANGQTPLQAWDFTSPEATDLLSKLAAPNFPHPVLSSLRAYQRYYYLQNAQ